MTINAATDDNGRPRQSSILPGRVSAVGAAFEVIEAINLPQTNAFSKAKQKHECKQIRAPANRAQFLHSYMAAPFVLQTQAKKPAWATLPSPPSVISGNGDPASLWNCSEMEVKSAKNEKANYWNDCILV
ncbi:hypothetical protein [Desulfatibacillum alkenivorans]|jgi:hypothetical protein|uniref:hypothetical protein n=1 Tax=Desulfatibacillum alkenivorans TaxID=259354 RepID=UPI001114777E|nr:hypothetical protein [Desulfatibacillum alkenivorans]